MAPKPRARKLDTPKRSKPTTSAPKQQTTRSRPSIQKAFNENGWLYFVKPGGQVVGLSKNKSTVNMYNYLNRVANYADSQVTSKPGYSKLLSSLMKTVVTIGYSFAITDIVAKMAEKKDTKAKPLAPFGAGANKEVYGDLVLASTIDALNIFPAQLPAILAATPLAVASEAAPEQTE